MSPHESYMHRCLELAKLGAGNVAPNPMVGSVLVYNDRIIGEGYHQWYGQAHAEVNCINSVQAEDKHLLTESTIYVSLEPCAHFGKTPPCADLIIRSNIARVVVGCRDPFEQVDGKGIEKLQHAGIEVVAGVLEKECISLNKRFFTFHGRRRPYVILKWAQSENGKIANRDFSRVLISNAYSNRLVHKWRSEEAGILVGTNTALLDDPALNARHWSGPDPVRLVLDLNLRLPKHLKVFDRAQKTIILNAQLDVVDGNLTYCNIGKQPLATAILEACYRLNIQSVLVEGGAKLLQTFIDAGLWDEARVVENRELVIPNGTNAPELTKQQLVWHETIASDTITYYTNAQHP